MPTPSGTPPRCCWRSERRGAWQSIQQAADLYRTPAGYLQNICARVQDEGYFVVLVIDQFETFTSSSQVQAEHHNINIMRNLVVNKQLSLVVDTGYDFDKNSLPAGVARSYLLQMFAGVDHTVELKGLSQEECARYLRQIAGGEQGVLERSLVGETLYRALFSPGPPPGLAGVPAAGGKGILGAGGRG